MKFDYYCVALVVLVLFFLYLDNYNNFEGFSTLDEGDSMKDKKPTVKFSDGVGRDLRIGQVPQKLAAAPPPSMKQGLSAVQSNMDGLTSLDMAFSPLLGSNPTSKQYSANLLSTGSRVGGKANLGDPSIGTIGGPVKPMGSDKVQGVPVLENPSIGAPLNYELDTRSLLSGVEPASPPSASPPSASPPSASPPSALKQGSGSTSGPKKQLELHMVHTTWCGHSKRAMPDFDKVMGEINGTTLGNHNISVVKHDADTSDGKAFAKEHNIRGFPTHLLIVDGKKLETAVGRTYDEIMNTITKITGS